MALRQAKRNVVEVRRQPSVQGKQPQGIRKKRAQISPRKSERLKDRKPEQKPSPASNLSKESPQTLSTPLQAKDRKRKRSQEFDDLLVHALAKRQQTSIAGLVVEATSSVTDDKTNPIDY